MALSRVRSLCEFRCIGLTPSIRDLIDLGPPEGFLTRFLKVFEEKAALTQKEIEDVLVELGWDKQEGALEKDDSTGAPEHGSQR